MRALITPRVAQSSFERVPLPPPPRNHLKMPSDISKSVFFFMWLLAPSIEVEARSPKPGHKAMGILVLLAMGAVSTLRVRKTRRTRPLEEVGSRPHRRHISSSSRGSCCDHWNKLSSSSSSSPSDSERPGGVARGFRLRWWKPRPASLSSAGGFRVCVRARARVCVCVRACVCVCKGGARRGALGHRLRGLAYWHSKFVNMAPACFLSQCSTA